MNAPQADDDLRVAYVLGSGRSGSTIFDIALGSHEDICAVGELTNLPRAGWINNEYCACGARTTECEFWSKVFEKWQELTQGADAADFVRLQQRVETNRRLITTYLGFGNGDETEFDEYARLTMCLYRAIAEVSGKSVIVDSSKAPRRAMALAKIAALDIRFIHLIRDVRGVAWSLMKAFEADMAAGVQRDIPPRSVARTATFWVLVNVLAELVLARQKAAPRCRMHYEGFVQSTDEELRRISGLIDVDLSTVARTLRDGIAIDPAHTVAGNRVRMSSSIRLRLDDAWRNGLTRPNQATIRMIAGLLMRRYGYGQ